MIYNQILVRFGDLTLKGKNQKEFLRKLYELMARKMQGLDVQIENAHDRIYINFNENDVEKVCERLKYVSGISSYSLVVKCSDDLDEIKKNALELINDLVKEPMTFKVETKRANKNYPLTSLEVTKRIAG